MDLTDSLLIKKTLEGSLECFDVLMLRHERDVYRTVGGFGRSREDALDICQVVFLKVYRNLRSFDGRSSFRTWLMRIAVNEGLNWVRSQQRTTASRIEPAQLETAVAAPGESQEEALLAKERRRLIVRHMAELKPRNRLAVTLRYFQDMSIREIAEILECSEDVVRNTLFRSVRKLKQVLAAQ